MNLSKLNEWTGIISNIGVLLGVIFLIIEINQNTRAIESEVIWAHAAVTTQMYTSEADNPELAAIFGRYQNMTEGEYRELRIAGDPNVFRFNQTYIARLNYWQARYLTQQEPADRERLKGTIALVLRSKVVLSLMRSFAEGDTLHQDFARFLMDIIEDIDNQTG